MSRTEYSPREEARKALKFLTPEQLASKETCELAVKQAKVKGLSAIILGKVRKELQNGTNGHANNEGDLLKRIGIVSKAIKAVGSLEKFKATIAVIEKVRAL